MGQFIRETAVRVGLVGVKEPTARRLAERLTTATAHDPGTFEVLRFSSLSEAGRAVNADRVHALCIAPESYAVEEVTSFVSDVRVTHPLVPFCLVGTRAFLKRFPGYHEAWRDRFGHYYQLASDVGDDDFAENAGLVRDLFVADYVKCRALGQYETTPGAVIRLKAPRPYGFWLLVAVSLLAAVIGGAVGPVIERWLPPGAEQGAGSETAGVAPALVPAGAGADR